MFRTLLDLDIYMKIVAELDDGSYQHVTIVGMKDDYIAVIPSHESGPVFRITLEQIASVIS